MLWPVLAVLAVPALAGPLSVAPVRLGAGLPTLSLPAVTVLPTLSAPALTFAAPPAPLPTLRAAIPQPTAAATVAAPARALAAAAVLEAARVPDAQERAQSAPEALAVRAQAFFAAPAAAASAVVPDAPVDETARLKRFQRLARSGRGRLPAAAARHDYLLVPGLLWDVVDGYFEPNRRRLSELGLSARIVPTDPLGRTSENAARIAESVRQAGRPVVILAHSKAALEVLEALDGDPALAGKVAAVVAIQTPYFGAALSDWVLRRWWLTDAAMASLRLLLAPRRIFDTMPLWRAQALRDISKAERGGLPPVRPGSARLRLFSVASRLRGSTRAPWASWFLAGLLRAATGADSDGLVAAEDQVVPGSRYALLDHVSHLDTVSEPGGLKHRAFGARGHDPAFAADLTEAVVRWVFSKAGG